MPPPTASRSAPLVRSRTICHLPPARRKTTQPAVLPQLGIASDATIAWLPVPTNAPQSTWPTGSETLGSSALPRCSRSTTLVASALEHGPAAAVVGAGGARGLATFARLRTAVSTSSRPRYRDVTAIRVGFGPDMRRKSRNPFAFPSSTVHVGPGE